MKRSPDDGNCAAENFGHEVRDAYEAHLTEVLGVMEELAKRTQHKPLCGRHIDGGMGTRRPVCNCGLAELLTKAEALTQNP